MSVAKWSNAYRTGVAEIDSEHQHLFALIKSVSENCKGGRHAGLTAAFKELVDYVDYHFRREEALMAECNYSGRGIHIEEHHKLEQLVQSFKEDYESNPSGFDAGPFVEFLSDWLTHHILAVDMSYVPCIGRRIDSVVDR